MKLPPQVAGFDSASAMVIALARFLHGQATPPLGKPAFRALRPAAAAASLLPARAQESLYSLFSGAEGRDQSEIARLDVDTIFAAITRTYPRRRYPAVVIGSSGGALVHLCAAPGCRGCLRRCCCPYASGACRPTNRDGRQTRSPAPAGLCSTATRTSCCTTCTTRTRTG